METPLVSICSITYNHAPFIRQCLDGFLMQQCNFPIEIIINDDCSTDGTTEIIREYAEKYPDKIFPIFHEENLYSQGVRGMFLNFVFPKARGKYIALCEGDDYWTDPLKLQKQVNFLESHPEYSLTCSDATVLGNSGELTWKRYDESCEVPIKDVILKRGAWIYTASMLYRWELMQDFPDFSRNCHVVDYPMAIHLALRGKVYFFAEKMVTYRFLTAGSWSARTSINEAYFNSWLSEIRMLQGYNEQSQGKYATYFQTVMGKLAIFYLRHAPGMKNKVLSSLPNFPKWLDLSDKLKWWRIILGISGLKAKLKKSFCKKTYK